MYFNLDTCQMHRTYVNAVHVHSCLQGTGLILKLRAIVKLDVLIAVM